MTVETNVAGRVAARPIGKLGLLLAFLATACWSTTGPIIEVLSRDYHLRPIDISLWRALFITGLLGPLVFFREGWQGFALTRREFWLYLVNGIIGIAIFNVAWSASVQANGAPVATTLIYCAPAFVALGSWPLLGDKPTLERLVAVAINITGCSLVAGVYDPVALFHSPAGFLLGISSGLTFAIYTLLGKFTSHNHQRSALSSLFYPFLFSLLLLLPWGLVERGPTALFLPLDGFGWLWLAGLAYGPTLGGYIFFTFSLKFLPAAVASLLTTLEPPITAVLSWLLLGRSMTLVQWVGALLIVSGVMLLQLNNLRQSLKERANNRLTTEDTEEIQKSQRFIELEK